MIVFDDPDCPWCRKLHGEIKKVVALDPEVAFYVRLYARNNNPKTVKKALSIVCGKKNAAKLLDDAFAGKKLPEAKCKTKAVEETASWARKLGITGTPANAGRRAAQAPAREEVADLPKRFPDRLRPVLPGLRLPGQYDGE